ncbi:hypothetical protein ACEYX6_07200 [Acinetobacter sp. c2-A9]|uniref:hypothetical protein n=1 Tax=Acinetobacter sp. c2-A9 TaxID=3342802 RepID=UPI0035B91503
MQKAQKIVLVLPLLLALVACNGELNSAKTDAEKLQQQEQKQGYPVLIATPTVADYGLPFCEKRYCLEVEIFDFKSQDQWFNQFTNEKIADLIRKQLGIGEKMTLQQAVDVFVQRSDEWRDGQSQPASATNSPSQTSHESAKTNKSAEKSTAIQNKEKRPASDTQDSNVAYQGWRIYAQPQVILQKNQLAFLKLDVEYDIAGNSIPMQSYFYVADRKDKKQINLYDIIDANHRLDMQALIQQSYQTWHQSRASEPVASASRLNWGSQDWYWNEDKNTISIYYRLSDLGIENTQTDANFVVDIPSDKVTQWVSPSFMAMLQPNTTHN